MPEFNICLPEPPGYGFSLCLFELCELLMYSLQDLGFDTTFKTNWIDPKARNIVVGCHLLDPDLMSRIPANSVMVNTEQIYDRLPLHVMEKIMDWVRNFETWDYSAQNIAAFDQRGIPGVKLLQLGHQQQLARIPKAAEQDIDVLFYGTVSDRRVVIADQIADRGLQLLVLFQVFGQERDEYISRSKLVLNMHTHATEIFEIVRVHYLLSNSVAVVSEVNPTTSIPEFYRDAVAAAPYESLADECVRLVRDDEARQALARRGFSAISHHPQTEFTKLVLS